MASKQTVKALFKQSQDAKRELMVALESAPDGERRAMIAEYRRENPLNYHVKPGASRKPARRRKATSKHTPAARTPRLDACRVALAHCAVKAAMIRRGVAL